ncbi:hypothetical protein V8B97DRAFT_959848 [Scleroderma yunnanense]
MVPRTSIMLARLSRQGNQWLSLHVERCISSHSDGESFSVDLNLASLVSPPDLSWSHITGLLLSELESLEVDQEHGRERQPRPVASIGDIDAADARLRPRSPSPEGPKRRRKHSFHPSEHLVICPFDPSAPIVVISPCPDECRETSSWVPYQDARFGMRLTVPTHTPLNKVHPPLIAEFSSPAPRIENWQYMDGHWYAIMPPPEEQCRRGMYSRPASARTRSRSRYLRMVDSI